ncbi:M48 family metalloprotease [Streptomyces sp. NPDC101160]|uniref:M48 family metalloprotease n=1 Tax=Streptomyces sp. NPDC101160 TaxID=3366118 RepID=UPI00380DBA4B
MGVFVFLPLLLPLSAWPVARLAEHRLHPRAATRLLTGFAVVLALCSTLCLALLMVVGTAQLPGNPLPDGWSDPEVRAAVPYDGIAGRAAIPALGAVVLACLHAVARHLLVRRRAERALAGLPGARSVAVLPDPAPYAYALPGRRRHRLGGSHGRRDRCDRRDRVVDRRGRCGRVVDPCDRCDRVVDRVVVSTGMLAALGPAERRALFAHERAHLTGRHHRHLLAVELAARANPFLRPLRTAVSYTAERWADEEAAGAVGSRRTVARAIGRAALIAAPAPAAATLAHVSGGSTGGGAGPVPRRVAALLGPEPAEPGLAWPPLSTAVGLAVWGAAAGATVSALSSANSAVTLLLVLHAATPLV